MTTPFDALAAKLSAGIDALVQVVGDSIGQGLRTVSTPDPLHGAVGRWALKIGQKYDCNVEYIGAAYPGSLYWPGYNQQETLHTSSREGAPTLTLRNGSMGGAQTTHLISWIQGSQNLIPDPNPDLILTVCAFNDVINFATLLPRMQSLGSALRTRCATAPIVITTQSRSTGTYPTSYFLPSFSSVSNYYVGSPLNLTPALRESSVESGFWMWDTQQAFTHTPLTEWMTTNDTVGGLHPNSDGYEGMADWMIEFVPDPAPLILTAALDPITRGVPFSQSLSATSVLPFTWSIPAGELPPGFSLNATEGIIAGTTYSYASVAFTLRATVIGSPDIYSEIELTGEIGGLPFAPTTTVRPALIWRGHTYPSVLNEIRDSAAHPIEIVR